MSRAKQHWQTQRQMNEQVDGWPRWDRAYQAVLSWGSRLPSQERVNQEQCHAHRAVCESVDPNASTSPND
jgi:sulfur transfer protein SufE